MQSTEKSQKIFFEGELSSLVKVGLAVLCFLLAIFVISRLIYPFDVGFWEAFNWIPAEQLLEGKNPYAFAVTPPYSMSPYGIVYYFVLGIGVKIFGLQLWWAKIVSVVAFIFCVRAIAGITEELTGNREAPRVAVLATLAMFPMQFWIAQGRCSDFIALAFALTAMLIVFRIKSDKKTSLFLIFGVVLLLTTAFFARQTLLLPSGIIFLRLLQLQKWREAIFLAATLTALMTGGIFFLDYTSGGGYLWQHFTHAQRLPYDWSDARRGFLLILIKPAFAALALFLLIFLYQKRESIAAAKRQELSAALRSPELLLWFYFFLSLTGAFVSGGRIGANVNYYLENAFIAAILGGTIYAYFRRAGAKRLTAALVILLFAGGAVQFASLLRGEYYRWQSLAYYREVFERAREFIKPGDECISVYPEIVVWSGCKLNFTDFQEYEIGLSPELREVFEAEIKSGRYAVIIWKDELLMPKFPNYRMVSISEKTPEKFPPVYLYVREMPAQ